MAWTLWRGWVAGAARRRVAGLLLVTLTAGLGGGFSMLSIIGAQRADSSWDRARAETRAQDVLLGATAAELASSRARQFREVDGVRSTTALYVGGLFAEPTPGRVMAGQVLIGLDEGFGLRTYRPVVVDGRRPQSAFEVLANREFLDRSRLSVGDSVAVRIADGPDSDTGVAATIAIVGEHRGPIDETFSAGSPLLVAHPDLWQRWSDELLLLPDPTFAVMLRLDEDVDADTFLRRPDVQALTSDLVEVVTAAEQELLVHDAIRVQTVAFVLIGLVSAVVVSAGLVVLINLEVRNLLHEHATVRSLGADRHAVAFAASMPFLIVGAGGAVIAGAVAVLLSRWVPIGLPRRIEPSPGSWITASALSVGTAAVVAVCGVAALVSAHAVQRSRRRIAERPALTTSIARWSGIRPAIGIGIAAAGGGATRTSIGPARITTVAAAVAALLVTGAASIHQSEFQVTTHPELSGYPFDLEVGGYDPDGWPATVEVLHASDDVDSLTLAEVGSIAVDGRVRQAAGYRTVQGSPLFTILEGRLPVARDEIAVGARSALTIGSTHEISATSSRPATVVGRVILNLGDGADDAEVLANVDALESIGTEFLTRTALVGLRDPARKAAARAELADVVHGRTETPFVCGDDVADRYLPALLADPPDDEPCLPVVGTAVFNAIDLLPLTRVTTLFLAVVGLGVTAQGLLMIGRRRRREVAVLRALGFDRRQVVASSMWLGLTVAVAAIAVGVTAGVVAGRAGAAQVAGATGVLTPPGLPWATIVVVVAGLTVCVVVASTLAGVGALRRSTVDELRTE